MPPRDPIREFDTHEVMNQPPPMAEYNLFESDPVLAAALEREGGAWAKDRVRSFGAMLGTERVFALGETANRFPPELHRFDPSGQRIDEVRFHPAYHELMALGISHGVHSTPWNEERPGGHVVHAALEYLLVQVEAGVCCPLTMTAAAIPTLRRQESLAKDWEPKILSSEYDPRFAPVCEKRGATIGMAMTEKQGGSDVRSNTTKAHFLGTCDHGRAFSLTGHKWFCSAPMSDAFLTLAYSDKGLSCFFVPRWRPDGTRNPILLQRLKDKLGNHANASSEIEYKDTWACLVGEEGDGVRTIIEMVHQTRLDTALAAAGLMRQAVVRAVHHAVHRRAFQKKLVDQPLMRNVLADLVLEWLAATIMIMRIARAYDEAGESESSALFARVGVAVAKYWINKRLSPLVYEAMECLGGSGYVEESTMPRLYREAPLNSIWEGSGNVICLDVLRALRRTPESLEIFLSEVTLAQGMNTQLDATIAAIKDEVQKKSGPGLEWRARRLVELMALGLQGSLVLRHTPTPIAEVFLTSRLSGSRGHVFGTIPLESSVDDLIGLARVG